MGTDLPRLWNEQRASVEAKKQILRTIIEEIVVTTSVETAEYRLHIHWSGGVHTELCVTRNKRGLHRRTAEKKVVELIEELVKVCDDKTLAGVLNRLGYRTGQGNNWSAAQVAQFRFHPRHERIPKKRRLGDYGGGSPDAGSQPHTGQSPYQKRDIARKATGSLCAVGYRKQGPGLAGGEGGSSSQQTRGAHSAN